MMPNRLSRHTYTNNILKSAKSMHNLLKGYVYIENTRGARYCGQKEGKACRDFIFSNWNKKQFLFVVHDNLVNALNPLPSTPPALIHPSQIRSTDVSAPLYYGVSCDAFVVMLIRLRRYYSHAALFKTITHNSTVPNLYFVIKLKQCSLGQ